MPSSHTIGIDTGGTFTDVVLINAQGAIVATHKLPSTPDDPSRAVLAGIDAILAKASATGEPPAVVHGSTVATNALLEGEAGNAAMLTTAGFEDVLRLARQERPELYALVPRRPDPPIPPAKCVGIAERMGFDGQVITPLDQASLREALDKLAALDVESAAVCLLHSYANPAHERAVAAALRERFGEALHLTVSSELLPEFREYERSATCAVNAVVAATMSRYLGKLEEAIGAERLSIMGSHGGTLSVAAARREPVRTVLSGPAGGVLGAAAFGDRLITLDMGGTSTDVALIHDQPTMTTDGRAGGLPVRLPMVDIHTIGAGGGSIAWLDPGGALRVGPRSAGASPGPACYGHQRELIAQGKLTGELPGELPGAGGWWPTVTDAHVVLGHIPSDATLGDDVTLDAEAAHDAVGALAKQSDMSVEDAAAGILRIVEANMARAIQRVTLQVGRDPRDYALMPFGGAGALHACSLAQHLGITTVHIPPNPGLLSAIGMLTAPPRRIAIRSLHRTIPAGETEPELSDVFGELADSLTEIKRWPKVEHAYEVDMRYAGQSFEITLEVGSSDHRRGNAGLTEAFHAEHERLYGYRADDLPIELVAVRCIASGPSGPKPFTPASQQTPTREAGNANRIARASLTPGDRRRGPCIITEYSATTHLPAGWVVEVKDDHSLIARRNDD